MLGEVKQNGNTIFRRSFQLSLRIENIGKSIVSILRRYKNITLLEPIRELRLQDS